MIDNLKMQRLVSIVFIFATLISMSTVTQFFPNLTLISIRKIPSLSVTPLPELLWNKTWGGINNEGCLDIALDSQSNIYLVGYTGSYGAGGHDIALVKLDVSGEFLWYRTWGTSTWDCGFSIQIDYFDNIYVAGIIDEDGTPRNAIIKYSNDGEELWNKTWITSIYNFWSTDIALDSSNNVYFCGKGSESNEYYLGKFDSLGNLIWNQTWIETIGSGACHAVDLDSNGNIYTLGRYTGNFDAFRLFKFNSSGNLVWDEWWGEELAEYGWVKLYDVKCDSNQNIFLGGFHRYDYNEDTQDDVLLLKYNSSGSLLWNTSYGDVYDQNCLKLAIDKYDNIYTVGLNEKPPVLGGDYDLLIIKFDNSGTLLWNYTWGTSSSEPWNNGIALDSFNNIFLGGVSLGDMFLLKLHSRYFKVNKPLSNEIYGSEAPTFELEFDIEYIHSTWYTINDGLKIFFSGESGKINQIEWDLYGDGIITIKFYANDSFSYLECTQVIVRKDTIKPNLLVHSPLAYQLYGNQSPNFWVSIDDPNLDMSWYTLDGGISNYTFTGFWNTLDQTAWDAYGNGTVPIEFYANDTAGNIASQELIIRKDIYLPYIKIISPQLLKYYSNESLKFEIEIYGNNINSTWYNLNNGIDVLFSGKNGTINHIAWEACLDGKILLKFFINDSSSRIGFQDIIIYKDSLLPTIDIISPVQNQYFLDTVPNYEVIIFDINLNKTWYSLDNGKTNYTFNNCSGSINHTAWESLLNGYVNITFYAIDHAGNIGYNVIIVIKNQTIIAKNAYAIIIGISNYPGSDYDLNYCDDDAIAIYNMIINDYNFKPENIIYLQDMDAVKSNIDNAFDSINSIIRPNDIFLFYYSGHGGRGTYSTQGIWNAESLHPYWDNYDQIWSISHPGAIYMRAHFERFQTEPVYDYLLCGGWSVTQGSYYELLTGDLGYDYWSSYIPVSNYYIRFISDSSNPYPYYGFKIDKYEAILEDGTHYLCSYDSIPDSPSKYYLDSLIDSKLDSLNCVDKYIVIDACYSGGLIPEVQDIGRYIMTACENDEESLETNSLEHGIFTYYFLESKENADDKNDDGVISIEECYDYIYSNTVSYSGGIGSEYTYHPQDYDGINGESVLYPSIGSINISIEGNEMLYLFNLYGHGFLKTLTITVCSISPSITLTTENLRNRGISPTGFGYYSGVIELEEGYYISGIRLLAEVVGNSVTFIELNFGDSDGDGLTDLFEILNSGGLDPNSNDTDEDALNDFDEYYGPTDPFINDTDNDGLLDGEEVHKYNTNPLLQDSDDDKLTDYEEVNQYFTEPTMNDTDDDRITDGYEIFNGLDPLNNDADLDLDNDGLSNLYEFQIGTCANNSDSDADRMPDGWEFNNSLDPLIDDSALDIDKDDLSNLQEYQEGTDPNNADTDGDGYSDGDEILVYDTDPLDPDDYPKFPKKGIGSYNFVFIIGIILIFSLLILKKMK